MTDSEYLTELEAEQGTMTREHLQFARAHDWGTYCELIEGNIILYEVAHYTDNGQSITQFTSFNDLLTWAGY